MPTVPPWPTKLEWREQAPVPADSSAKLPRHPNFLGLPSISQIDSGVPPSLILHNNVIFLNFCYPAAIIRQVYINYNYSDIIFKPVLIIFTIQLFFLDWEQLILLQIHTLYMKRRCRNENEKRYSIFTM